MRCLTKEQKKEILEICSSMAFSIMRKQEVVLELVQEYEVEFQKVQKNYKEMFRSERWDILLRNLFSNLVQIRAELEDELAILDGYQPEYQESVYEQEPVQEDLDEMFLEL